jgi:SAM-dependent methyltransferase
VTRTGWLDSASFTRASGWANAPVSVHVNGVLVATVTPAIPRPDVPAGSHGFNAPIDPLLLVRGENEVRACYAGSDTPIGGGVKPLELTTSPAFISGCSLAGISRGLWSMVDIRRIGEGVTLEGWFVAPPGSESPSVFSDGEDLSFSCSLDPTLRTQLWLPVEAPVFRFAAAFKFRAPNLRISFGALGRSFNPDHDCIIPREPSLHPERERIRRVSGGYDMLKFDIQGATNAERLENVFARHGRAALADARVMDWGVGAGRVARFLAPRAGHFHGVDVDADNLAWCKDNLPGAYQHIDTDPPIPLPSQHFDFIYGISVVTHLTLEYEKRWLAELRRLVKDGGIVALSIHGPVALMMMGLCHRNADLVADGFVDLGENKILAGRVPDGYYRNVAQSFSHLHKVWGEFFTIADIMPGAIGLQDLVVLRPR